MGTARTAWHVIFAALVTERAPPGIDVRPEVQITTAPQRTDLLLLRRSGEPVRDHEARVLRGLWPLLGLDTLVEFKSISRPFRPGDLVRLLGYGAQYQVEQVKRPLRAQDLSLALVVPDLTAPLLDELALMGWRLTPLEAGYAQIFGGPYPTFVAAIDQVAEAERDDLLRMFGHNKIVTREARWWWEHHLTKGTEGMSMQDLEDYDEVFQKLIEAAPVERRLAGLSPEERLNGLSPKEQLTGLSPDQLLLALPDELLCGFRDECLATLPAEVQEAIRKRTGR